MSKTFDPRKFLADNLVVVIFLVVTAFAVPVSGLSAQFIIQELFTRIGRNAFLVFSLLLPIMAGMGINFGMVLGAMAGEIEADLPEAPPPRIVLNRLNKKMFGPAPSLGRRPGHRLCCTGLAAGALMMALSPSAP